MRNNPAKVLILALVAISLLVLPGCEKPKENSPDFSNARYVAELATLECYYHNVSRIEHSGSWFFDQGYRKMWFEYSGIVEVGIDISKVHVAQPDENGVVVITIPQAEIQGTNVDEESFTDPISERSWPFTRDFTAEERQQAFIEAQQEMRENAESDDTLKAQARERAKDLLEEYVQNVGEELGQSYTVRWEDAE